MSDGGDSDDSGDRVLDAIAKLNAEGKTALAAKMLDSYENSFPGLPGGRTWREIQAEQEAGAEAEAIE